MTAPVSEKVFQQQIVDLATALGWRYSFNRPTRGRGGGWTTSTTVPLPDLMLWHPLRGGFMFRELKVGHGKDGTIRSGQWKPGQLEIIGSLRAAGVDVDIWTPKDWDAIECELGARKLASLAPVAPRVVP